MAFHYPNPISITLDWAVVNYGMPLGRLWNATHNTLHGVRALDQSNCRSLMLVVMHSVVCLSFIYTHTYCFLDMIVGLLNMHDVLDFYIVAHSFMMGCPKMGMNLRVAAPKVSVMMMTVKQTFVINIL